MIQMNVPISRRDRIMALCFTNFLLIMIVI